MRVLVISDVRLYRDGLCEILARRKQVEIAGTVAQADAAGVMIRQLPRPPDVALIDIAEPNGIDGLRCLTRDAPGLPVVAITVPDRARDVIACAEAGAVGFVTREASLDDLVDALEGVARGEVRCSPRLTAALFQHLSSRAIRHTQAGLTNREREILDLIDAGLSNKSIAGELCIELPTVKNHVHRIIEKLGVTNRMQAAAWMRSQVVP